MHSRYPRLGVLIAADAALAYALVTAFSSELFITAFMLAIMLVGAISETALLARTDDDHESD
jgi:hypothetical protein